MANLSTKIKIYAANNGVASVDFMNDVVLQDDMIDGVSNPYIKEWNIEGLAQPTDEQLSAQDAAATTEENNATAISNRKNAYPSLGDVVDAIFKKEAGDATEFNSLAAKRQSIKDANPKE
jgi:hypothetical protein